MPGSTSADLDLKPIGGDNFINSIYFGYRKEPEMFVCDDNMAGSLDWVVGSCGLVVIRKAIISRYEDIELIVAQANPRSVDFNSIQDQIPTRQNCEHYISVITMGNVTKKIMAPVPLETVDVEGLTITEVPYGQDIWFVTPLLSVKASAVRQIEFIPVSVINGMLEGKEPKDGVVVDAESEGK